jgi:hypothetical protein
MHKATFLQNVIYVISALGILMGIDLLLGARATANFNKKLDKMVFDFDQTLTKFFSHCKKKLEWTVNIDTKIIHSNIKLILGTLFIIISVVLFFLARRG